MIAGSWLCKRHVLLAKLLPYMNKRLYIISSNLANAPCMVPTHTKQLLLHLLHMYLGLACNCVYSEIVISDVVCHALERYE